MSNSHLHHESKLDALTRRIVFEGVETPPAPVAEKSLPINSREKTEKSESVRGEWKGVQKEVLDLKAKAEFEKALNSGNIFNENFFKYVRDNIDKAEKDVNFITDAQITSLKKILINQAKTSQSRERVRSAVKTKTSIDQTKDDFPVLEIVKDFTPENVKVAPDRLSGLEMFNEKGKSVWFLPSGEVNPGKR